MMTCKSIFFRLLCLVTLLGLVSVAEAMNEVFLSNDTAQSKVTYIIQFETGVNGNIDKIRITLPPGTNAAIAALGRVIIEDKVFQGDDVTSSVDPSDPNTLIVDLRDERNVKPGTKILVELFNLSNPVAGNYAIDVTTIDKMGMVIEMIPPIAYSTFPVGPGDITAVNAGTGLTGGGDSGDVTLNVDTSQIQKLVTGTCPAGSSIRVIDASGNVVCETDDNSGGTVTSVGTAAGLTGGPITATGTISVATGGITSAMIQDGAVGTADLADGAVSTPKIADNAVTSGKIVDGSIGNADLAANSVDSTKIVDGGVGFADLAANSVDSSKIVDGSIGSADVNNAQIQLRITSSCPAGQSIRQVNADGTVVCEVDDNSGGTVTAVTASAPLVSSGGTTPNISLPNVIIGTLNTGNTAIGTSALTSNIGFQNTASGVGALGSNTSGGQNTASGYAALFSNISGSSNTAIGFNALLDNTTGSSNTASGRSALQNNTGSSNTASGADALRDNSGSSNTASGVNALRNNTTGSSNTASGFLALFQNITGSGNTAIGFGADVSPPGNLTNATAIGAGAIVNASNKVRIGNASVTVIEGQAAFTAVSDKNKKENFKPVDGEEVLKNIRGLDVTSWNYIGQDPKEFRHYGPVAQDFFAAFGNDRIGAIGTPTTINSGDMAGILMAAVKALERRTMELKEKDAEIRDLKARLERLEQLVKDRSHVTAAAEPVQ